MVKKTTSFRLEPETLKRLKIHAVHLGVPIGDVIKRFMDLAEHVHSLGGNSVEGFGALWLDYVFNDIDEKGEFIPPYKEGVDSMRNYIEDLKRKEQAKQNELDQELNDLGDK